MRLALAASTIGIALAAAGGGYVAQRIREDALRVERSASLQYPMTVRAMSATKVRLDPGGAPILPTLVSLGLCWEEGAAELGPVVAAGRGPDVTRRVVRIEGAVATAGTPARITATPWGRDPATAHGYEFEEIAYAAPGGPIGAWWVPGPSETCAIIVHGRGADRQEGLRLLGSLRGAGLSALIIRYRNDPDSPGDGIARFGQAEWEDLAAAVDVAATRGARRLVLAGISMGGAVVMAFLQRGRHPVPIVGVILDAPVLSLRATIDATAGRLVGPLAHFGLVRLGRGISSWRDGIDWHATDYLSRARDLAVPVLLVHDRDDRLIPIATSDVFAARRPDLVRYHVTRGAGHTLSWNADPKGYDAAVAGFLSDLRVTRETGS